MTDSRQTGGHFEIACPDGFEASLEVERLRKAEAEAGE